MKKFECNGCQNKCTFTDSGDTANEPTVCPFSKNALNIDWKELSISNDFHLRDLWKKTEVGNTTLIFEVEIQGRDVVLLRLSK